MEMTKNTMLKIVNSILFVSAAIQIFTSIALFFHLFTPQTGIFKVIIKAHVYNGLMIIILILIHLSLNWAWVKTNFLKF